MASRPIPRRTSEIELWDVNPVGNRDSFNREMLQFWSLMVTRGRRVRTPGYLTVLDHGTGKNRSLTTLELADLLADRMTRIPGALVTEPRRADIQRWLRESVIVVGERGGRGRVAPAAGLRLPHYAALVAFNRSATRERFWATFFYGALKSDLDASVSLDRPDLAGPLVERFLSVGLELDEPPSRSSQRVSWSIDFNKISQHDPELLLVTRALTVEDVEGPPSVLTGLPAKYFVDATATAKGGYEQFLCPGSIVQLRRSLRLLLGAEERVGHAALGELIETTLVLHATTYFIRGMRVLNDLNTGRGLSSSCQSCWDRFQEDVKPPHDAVREERWRNEDYQGSGTAEETAWIDANCDARPDLFMNAGRKEDSAAKDLARMSLEKLRRELATYTVNRIVTSLALDVAASMATSLGEPRPGIASVYQSIDRWAKRSDTKVALALLWDQKIDAISQDKDVPGHVMQDLAAFRWKAAGDPAALEELARTIVSEAILSARAFTRYVELLNSLLGGGALPSNQDPKGLMARGGSRATPFHLSINDRALELLVALQSLEAEELRNPLSFQEFIAALSRRYGFEIEGKADDSGSTSGLVAEASTQSRDALRARLHSMGFLQEFSDSSNWNRVSWRAGKPK